MTDWLTTYTDFLSLGRGFDTDISDANENFGLADERIHFRESTIENRFTSALESSAYIANDSIRYMEMPNTTSLALYSGIAATSSGPIGTGVATSLTTRRGQHLGFDR